MYVGKKTDTSSNYCDNSQPYDKRHFSFYRASGYDYGIAGSRLPSRKLTSGFDFWSRGDLHMAVMHLSIKLVQISSSNAE